MSLPRLDPYVLSLLDRGIDTTYSLQRVGGLSLGASTPSLRRLAASRLVKRQEEAGRTNRPKHVYVVTAAGRELARNGWRDLFQSSRMPSDLDQLLRVADMATYYGARTNEIAEFLKLASEHRKLLARQADAAVIRGTRITAYQESRSRCETARLKAEAGALAELAKEVSEAPSNPHSTSGKKTISHSAALRKTKR